MLRNVFIILSLLITMEMTGCASIVSKTNYPVAINSSPDQAEFIVTNKDGVEIHRGKTPTTVILKSGRGYFKSEEYKVIFNKDGFTSTTATISSSLDGWYVGNILFGGLIGFLIVDPATGAMWKLPETVSPSLYETETILGQQEQTLHVLTYDDVPESVREDLVDIGPSE